jgi:DNA-binding LacI/PurR family transcriptional regulator
LPPVRLLSGQLGVSLSATQRAVRLLERERIVECQHGVGVRVLGTERLSRTPLTFGLIYPFRPETPFAGAIHCFTEQAIDMQENFCIVKSSNQDPGRERELVEQFLNSGAEGLLVWPCPGNTNTEFFVQAAGRTPMVFIDRTQTKVGAPSVVLDWAGAGRDVVSYLASQGCRRVLVLEDPLEISSYREMFNAMKETVGQMKAEHRFDFVGMDTTQFVERYPEDPEKVLEQTICSLKRVLSEQAYDALFCIQENFLDQVYANSGLYKEYPLLKVTCMSNTLAGPRNVAFYKLGVRMWVADHGKMIGKAAKILHDMVHLRSRPQGETRIKFGSMVVNSTS